MFIPLFSGSMVQLKIAATNKMETVIQKVLQRRDDTVPPVEPQDPWVSSAQVLRLCDLRNISAVL